MIRLLRLIGQSVIKVKINEFNEFNHFVGFNKMIELGKTAKRKILDYELSRYACYLIVQNADPSKEVVALGQHILLFKQESKK